MQNHRTIAFPARRSRRSFGPHRQRGLTLIEWMVSITIGLVLLVALSALIAQQSGTQSELEKSSRQVENGRHAMQLLQNDIQLAGYFGEFSDVASLPPPTTLPNPCAVTAGLLTAALPFPIQGFDAPGSTLPTEFAGCPSSFIAANHLDGTDILVVRSVEPSAGMPTLTVGQAYLQSGLAPGGQIFTQVLGLAAATSVDTGVFNLKTNDGSTAALRRYQVHIYFVSPCSVPASGSNCSTANTDDGGVSIPTLKRLELTAQGGAAVFKTTALVEGIENLQIDYGFDNDGDGVPDIFLTDIADPADPASVATWADVMAMRVHLLARNNERSGDHIDAKTYNLGLAGSTTATGDKFKRKVFSQLVRVVNPSSRRAQ